MTAWGIPPGFTEHRTHTQVWWLRTGWEEALTKALEQSPIPNPQSADSELRTVTSPAPNTQYPTPKSGGRGATQRVDVGERGAIVVRHYRRGGFVRYVTRDLYWDRPPRPFTELICTETARQRGVPTVEVLSAGIEWSILGLYRGTFITREATGYINLWEWLQTRPTGVSREAYMTAVAQAVAQLHVAGIEHTDLNLTNLLITTGEDEPKALLIDFDRARVFSDPLPPHRRTRNLRRLRRSLQKLDPTGQLYSPSDLETFCRAYHRS